ncbi:hypothetical protein HSBAA_41630 [Vreelandella sulfidaeris]|uniref:GIY-YIG domain-containing protein n=1 Tax=Vreelandella sulfidaeris TaxID=115553 RepID=A0A455UB94_9GAMM|nr:hypothetical protein HSBAA_41630 [Halomonas sulfidaeris]
MTFDSKQFLSSVSTSPGVYRMLDEQSNTLYVGKAKRLKARLASYFRGQLNTKTQAMVGRIADIQVTVTRTETEALLLEQTLIKQLRPPYNILLRDDKSYPFVFVTDRHSYPALEYKRVRQRSDDGRYLGPYPSSGAVRESLALMQKYFESAIVKIVSLPTVHVPVCSIKFSAVAPLASIISLLKIISATLNTP